MKDTGRIKICLTLGILLSGAVFGFLFAADGEVYARQSSGLVIDFGDRDVSWTDADLSEYQSPIDLLEYACEQRSYSLSLEGDDVTEINGVYSDKECSWDFWVIEDTSDIWKKVGPEHSLKGCKVYAWAYCSDGQSPAVAVDATGNSIYGYGRANTVVSLSPSITEILGSINAVTAIVGVDQYSTYPHSVAEGVLDGSIAVIGGYVNPSFELIMKADPDMVFCDGSQYYHIDMQKKLIDSGHNAVVVYDGEDIDTILDNIFIIGTVMGYDMAADNVISDVSYSVNELQTMISESPLAKGERVMVSLSGDKSPWVSGGYTYVNDVIAQVGCTNVMDFVDGWVHISPELIADSKPDVAVILMSKYDGVAPDYDSIISHMSDEWKSTPAYKNGRIYILTDSAADFAQRASPRVGQLTELFARMTQPDIFDDIELPKSIGDDYLDYLTFTKNQSYDN